MKNPDQAAVAWLKRGNKSFDSKNFRSAVVCYSEALVLKPEDPFLLNSKGLALKELGNHEEALRFFDLALERKPKLMGALVNRAAVLDCLERREEALECAEKALALYPRNLHARSVRNDIMRNSLNDKGIGLLMGGKPVEALVFFNKALDLDPKNENLLANREGAFRRLLTKKRTTEVELSDPEKRIAK